jgi:predicted RNase H-like HicB family nuclease
MEAIFLACGAGGPQLDRNPLGITPLLVLYCADQRRDIVTIQFTAVYEKVPEGYIAFVEELPGANTQAPTLEEARSSLDEAVRLVLEANRALAEEAINGKTVIREPLRISAA